MDSLKNLKNISVVVVGGKYYSEEKIKEKREAVRTRNEELHGFVRQYEEALAAEEYQKLLKIIEKAHKISPDKPVLSRSSLLSDAYPIYNSDEKETAYAMLDTVLKWFPEEYSAYYYWALSMKMTKEGTKPEATLRSASKLILLPKCAGKN